MVDVEQVKQMEIKLEVIKENDSYTVHMVDETFDDTIWEFNLDGFVISYQATLPQLYEEVKEFGFSTEEIDLAVQNAVQFF